jgi:dTDP-4-dehydrorhamnose 3,5-epimerase-like enzyme
VLWNDPEIGVVWPVENPILSGKDLRAQRLRDVADKLPLYAGS